MGMPGSSGSSCGPLWELSMGPAREPESGMLLKKAVEKSLSPRRGESASLQALCRILSQPRHPGVWPRGNALWGGFHTSDKEGEKKVKPLCTLHSVGTK